MSKAESSGKWVEAVGRGQLLHGLEAMGRNLDFILTVGGKGQWFLIINVI